MSRLDEIIERCEGADLKGVAAELADELWEVINATINTRAGDEDDWEKFYLPALRHGVLRRLAIRTNQASEGWLEVWQTAIEEEHGRENRGEFID